MKAPGKSCEHLGTLGGSFCLLWGAFWPHFGRLGTLFGLNLALLGRLGASRDAFFAQLAHDSEKTRFFEFDLWKLDQVGAQKSRKIETESNVFLRCVFDIHCHQ